MKNAVKKVTGLKPGVFGTKLRAYIRRKPNSRASNGSASPYEIASEWLIKDGYPRENENPRMHCLRHADVIQLAIELEPLDPIKQQKKRDLAKKRAESATQARQLELEQRKNNNKRQTPYAFGNLIFEITKIDPASKEFLLTLEWRTLRMKAIGKYGRKCQCCGATPEDGTTKIHVDHIKPRKFFPELALDINNLQILCETCNHGKGNWNQTDYRK